jgi:ABC-type phosphate transport system substrate-binding protein
MDVVGRHRSRCTEVSRKRRRRLLPLATIAAFALLLAALVASSANAAVGQTESWGKFGFGAAAEFSNPSMVGVDQSDGSVFVGDESEDHTAYRVQKLSPSGTVLGSATIPRYLDLPNPHLKKVGVWGIAVDASQHRFYVLEGGLQTAEESAGEWIAKRIRVFSTEPSAGKLVAPATGPSVITLPHTLSTDLETLYKPLAITVDPTSHDLLILAEGGSPKRVVIQRFSSTSATGTSLGRFIDTANKLRPVGKNPVGLAVASSGTIYTLTGRPDREGKGFTRLWELPSNLSAVTEVTGFATGFDAEEIPYGTINKNISTFTGSDQLSLSSDGKTIYWKEQVEEPEGNEAGSYLIRGYSLTEKATAQVYGGASSLTSCRITSPGAGFGVTGTGAGEKVVVLDTGPFPISAEPGNPAQTAPPYGDKVLTFGQNGSGCPVPVAKFKANGTEGNVKVAKGATVNFDASPSVLTSGPANTPGFAKELVWKFGDGTEQVVTGSGGGEAALTTSHTYGTSGNFEATLQIHLKKPTYGNPALISHKVEVEGGAPAEFELKVLNGGGGTIASSPAGISCPSECSNKFAEGTVITLTGTPNPGFKAIVWESCPGTINGSNQCVVTMSAAKEAKGTFAAIPSFQLKVVKNGTGSGTVTSSPAGINCGGECQASFAEATVVTLTGAADAGSKAVSWESCPGTINGSNQCVVTMSAAKEAKATFNAIPSFQLKVGKEGTGSGTVASSPAGINCGSECQANYAEGTVVTLTGTSDAGSKAVVWTSCPGVVNGSNQCVVTISAAAEAKAKFDLEQFQLKVTKKGTGSGTVTSSPAGINCGSECQALFNTGTVVTLTGTADAGSKAIVWTNCPGSVNGSNQCVVTTSAAKEAEASFDQIPSFQLKVTKKGTGSGTVTSSPAGINCGGECQASFAEGTVVVLTGTADSGSKAVSWDSCPGTVNGSNQCVVTISAAAEAKATFDLDQFQLKVNKNGSGSGTVTSSPAGINCGSECQAPFDNGTVVTLTGTPSGGSKAVSWTGCNSVNGSNQCVVTMSAAKEVEATFDVVGQFQLKVEKNGTGSGTVTSSPAGINCGSECQANFAEGTVVTLTGTSDAGSKAVVWQTCPGTVNGSNQCVVTLSESTEAVATFDSDTQLLKVTKNGSGSGTVSSSPAGINCGSECQASFAQGTEVKLSGTPNAGSKAATWTGCDSVNGSNECVVTMSTAKNVEATFALEVAPPVGCNGSNIVGEGSTAQGSAQEQVWIPGFQGPGGICNGKGTEPTVEYKPTGSGAGFAAWDFNGPDGTAFDKTRAFTASDDGPRIDQIENAEAASGSPVVVIPVAQTAITVAVNSPAGCEVNEITNKQLEEIWRGTLKRWGQLGTRYAIGAGCSGAPISRVVRSDGSGTTYQFKSYLGISDPAALACTGGKTWQQLAPIGADGTPNTVWPESGKGGCGTSALSPVVVAPGSGGGSVVAKVNATAGSIGYVALPTLESGKAGGTHWVKLQNNGNAQGSPTFAEPVEGGSANCLAAQYLVPFNAQVGQSGLGADWSRVFGSNINIGGDAYPLCTLTYDMALTQYGAAGFGKGTEETVNDYLTQYVTTGSGQDALTGASQFYASLPISSKPKRNVLGAAQLAAGKVGF